MKELSYKQNENLKKYILKNSTDKVIKRIKENYKNYDLKPTILGLIFEKVAEIDKDGYSEIICYLYMVCLDLHAEGKGEERCSQNGLCQPFIAVQRCPVCIYDTGKHPWEIGDGLHLCVMAYLYDLHVI